MCFLDGPWSGLGVTSRPNLSVVEVRNSLGGDCVDFHGEQIIQIRHLSFLNFFSANPSRVKLLFPFVSLVL